MKGALVTLMLTVLLTLTSTSSAAQDPGTSAQTAGRWKSTARHGLDCPQSIKAREGGSVTIQCRVDPTIDLTSCTVDLKRHDLNKFVYVYRHGKDDPDPVLEDYRGRVTLNKEDLPKGVVTLQISLSNRSDSGLYGVFVKGRRTSMTCMFNLTVVTKDQRNRTVRPGLTTAAPPVEEADHPSAETVKLVVIVVVLVVVVVIVIIVLICCGVVPWFKRRNIQDWTRKLRRWRKQREEMGNGDVLRRLKDDQDPNTAALNESRDQRV